MFELLIYSAFAGIFGTGIGGIIGVFFGKNNNKITSNVLAFAGGAMMGMVFFSIFKEALELSNPILVLLGGTLGVVFIYILSFTVEYKIKSTNKPLNIRTCFLSDKKINKITLFDNNIKYDDNYNKLNNNNAVFNLSKTNTNKEKNNTNNIKSKLKNFNMIKTGLIMFLAIGLHNIPEGMAIGSLGMIEIKNGLTLAILLLIHNIPEGMAISLPLTSGGFKKSTAIIISILAGSVTLIGGLIGIGLGSINKYITATTLAFAGGAMLNVTFLDIIPESIISTQSKKPMIYMLIGLGLIYLIVNYV